MKFYTGPLKLWTRLTSSKSNDAQVQNAEKLTKSVLLFFSLINLLAFFLYTIGYIEGFAPINYPFITLFLCLINFIGWTITSEDTLESGGILAPISILIAAFVEAYFNGLSIIFLIGISTAIAFSVLLVRSRIIYLVLILIIIVTNITSILLFEDSYLESEHLNLFSWLVTVNLYSAVVIGFLRFYALQFIRTIEDSKQLTDFLSKEVEERKSVEKELPNANEMTNKLMKSKQVKYINTLRQSSNNLLILVNDFLDLSKAESGVIDFEQIPFNIRDLIDTISSSYLHIIQKSNIDLLVNVDERIDMLLLGGPTRLKQILYNLISNSVKFTKEGFIKIEVQLIQKNKYFSEIYF
ncbi:MAG: hypothetical protein Q9M91_05100 [Candidatus Dojkabacteria bacterium]|nr:hypothetical protein [Candidatus Dojkabacteria bacterium]